MVTKKSFGKLQINMTNRWLYTLITLFAVVVLGVGVYAFGSTPNPGHSWTQIAGCDSSSQIPLWTGSAWSCTALPSGGTGGSWSESGSDIYYNAGKVGIGTSSPAAMLDVAGTLRVEGPTTGIISLKAAGSATVWSFVTANVLSIAESTNSYDLYLLGAASTGKVGIGTTSPGAKLEVNGKIISQATASGDSDTTVATKGYVDATAGGSSVCPTLTLYQYGMNFNTARAACQSTGTRLATMDEVVSCYTGSVMANYYWTSTPSTTSGQFLAIKPGASVWISKDVASVTPPDGVVCAA